MALRFIYGLSGMSRGYVKRNDMAESSDEPITLITEH